MKKILNEKELLNILKKRWQFISFIFLFFGIMIYQSHEYEKTILELSNLKEELKEVNSEFIYNRTLLMSKKNEEIIKKNVNGIGLKDLKYPPKKIIINPEIN